MTYVRLDINIMNSTEHVVLIRGKYQIKFQVHKYSEVGTSSFFGHNNWWIFNSQKQLSLFHFEKASKMAKNEEKSFFFSNCFQPGINSTTIHTKEYCSKLCILCCIPNITRWGGWLPLPKKNNAGGFTLLEFQESQL